jgi:hypothetical protein
MKSFERQAVGRYHRPKLLSVKPRAMKSSLYRYLANELKKPEVRQAFEEERELLAEALRPEVIEQDQL